MNRILPLMPLASMYDSEMSVNVAERRGLIIILRILIHGILHSERLDVSLVSENLGHCFLLHVFTVRLYGIDTYPSISNSRSRSPELPMLGVRMMWIDFDRLLFLVARPTAHK